MPLNGDNILQSSPTEPSATTKRTNDLQRDSRNIDSTKNLTKANDDVPSGDSDRQPIVSSAAGEQTAAILLKGPAYTDNDTLNLLHEASQRSEREHAKAVGVNPRSAGSSDKPYSNSVLANRSPTRAEPNGKDTGVAVALEAWNSLRFVRCGLFSAEEALAFVDYFYTFLAPFSPISSSVFKHPSQHPKLLEEEPILTVTILMVASRSMKLTGPGALSRSYVIHERMWKYLQSMITRVFWSEEHSIGRVGPVLPFSQPISEFIFTPSIFRSLGTCEALLILLEWHPRSLHFPSCDLDTTSIIVRDTGITQPSQKSIGRYGRLRSGIDWLARSDRMCWSLLGTALSVAVELGVFDENHNTTTKSFNDSDMVQDPLRDRRVYRIQKLIWAYSIQTSGRLGWKHLTPFPIVEQYLAPEDDTTNCWVGVSILLKKAIDLLFPSRYHTKEIVRNGEYVKYLQILQPMFLDWEKEFDNAKLSRTMQSMLAIEYGYVRVYAYSVALQSIAERRIRDLDSRDIESHVIPDLGVADSEHLRQITAAARSILRVVVYDIFPDDKLKYVPVRTYSRILAGSLCLLKTCAIDINQNEAGKSLEMIDAAAEALRNSVTDDLNLCTRWGELLQSLSSNLRERLEQKSATEGDPSKNATPSQSGPGNQSTNRAQPSFRSSPNPDFDASEQNMDITTAGTLANSDIFSANCFYYPGANQVAAGINGCAVGWDDLSLWLDPLGHASAANAGQMPWHGDENMYGMLEPFTGGVEDLQRYDSSVT